MKEVRVVNCKTHLGFASGGIQSPTAFQAALERKPHFVGVQAATGDYGPHFLGKGTSTISRAHIKTDLESFMIPCLERGIVFTLGGCPTAGTKSCVDLVLDILRDITIEHKLKFKLAVIYSDMPKEYLLRRLEQGERFKNAELPDHDLTTQNVEASTNIVSFMGWDPFISALDTGADVIITGRCCDDAIFSSPIIRAGFDPGVAWHLGKVIECGCMAAAPVNLNIPIMGTARADHFLVEPMDSRIACTIESVAAHNIYERSSTFEQKGPEGSLDLSNVRYEQYDERTVKVSGSRFIKSRYQLLVEGAGLGGYRSIAVLGVRDPEIIRRLASFQEDAEKHVREQMKGQADFKVAYHNYGIDGSMGAYEPNRKNAMPSYEVGVVTEVVAPTQTLASDICDRLYSHVHGFMYEDRVIGEGNYASPFSSLVLEVGAAYQYTINHLVPVDNLKALFPIHLYEVNSDQWQEVHHD